MLLSGNMKEIRLSIKRGNRSAKRTKMTQSTGTVPPPRAVYCLSWPVGNCVRNITLYWIVTFAGLLLSRAGGGGVVLLSRGRYFRGKNIDKVGMTVLFFIRKTVLNPLSPDSAIWHKML